MISGINITLAQINIFTPTIFLGGRVQGEKWVGGYHV